MSKKKNPILLWSVYCISCSIISAYLLFLDLNLSPHLSLDYLDGAFIFFVLTILSFALSSPYITYIAIKERYKSTNKNQIKEFNLVFILYLVILYFIFSHQMVSYREVFKLMISYFIIGLFTLNYHFSQKVNSKSNPA